MLEPQTWHILSYIDDQAFRRHVLIWLNKGETLHSMARAIFFGRQGRFMDRGYEAQLNRASALSLVLNAIVVWNTRHFDRAASSAHQMIQDDRLPSTADRLHECLYWAPVVLSSDVHSRLPPQRSSPMVTFL